MRTLPTSSVHRGENIAVELDANDCKQRSKKGPLLGINAYNYAQNNSLMLTDPSGRSSIFGWLLVAMFPLPSLILMNTTDIFQKNFGFTSGDIRSYNKVAITIVIFAAAAFTGGAAAGAVGGLTGAVVGGIVGGITGGVGFPALGLGDSHEGF